MTRFHHYVRGSPGFITLYPRHFSIHGFSIVILRDFSRGGCCLFVSTSKREILSYPEPILSYTVQVVYCTSSGGRATLWTPDYFRWYILNLIASLASILSWYIYSHFRPAWQRTICPTRRLDGFIKLFR